MTDEIRVLVRDERGDLRSVDRSEVGDREVVAVVLNEPPGMADVITAARFAKA